MADVAPVVLITGATSGLGRYLAGELAGSGWQVLAHGRDPGRVADLTAELGGSARGYVADPALDGVTGQFFDGLRTARALPRAYDERFRAQLREVTDQMLGEAA